MRFLEVALSIGVLVALGLGVWAVYQQVFHPGGSSVIPAGMLPTGATGGGSNDSPVRVTGGSLEIRSHDTSSTVAQPNNWTCSGSSAICSRSTFITGVLASPSPGTTLLLEAVDGGSNKSLTINWSTGGEIDFYTGEDNVVENVALTWGNGHFTATALNGDSFWLEPVGKYHPSRLHDQSSAGTPALRQIVVKPGDGSQTMFYCDLGECRIGFGS